MKRCDVTDEGLAALCQSLKQLGSVNSILLDFSAYKVTWWIHKKYFRCYEITNATLESFYQNIALLPSLQSLQLRFEK